MVRLSWLLWRATLGHDHPSWSMKGKATDESRELAWARQTFVELARANPPLGVRFLTGEGGESILHLVRGERIEAWQPEKHHADQRLLFLRACDVLHFQWPSAQPDGAFSFGSRQHRIRQAQTSEAPATGRGTSQLAGGRLWRLT